MSFKFHDTEINNLSCGLTLSGMNNLCCVN